MSNNSKPKLRYFIYARKSSEEEDRQVQSIDDQINFLQRIAEKENLEIVDILSEARSAKVKNNRPVFNSLIEKLTNGEADGILCWELNRLARSAEESGLIIGLLQSRTIKSIRTYQKEYLPEDNVLLMFVEFGISTQFSIDLSKNVKRGFEGKRMRGEYPHLAPIGYLNDKENHVIKVDPDRFDLVKKMWGMMLTGLYNPAQILDIANADWNFKTVKRKRMGGKPLSRSMIYRLFTNIFYAGIIEFEGKEYKGSHNPMITTEEFYRVQEILGAKGKPRPSKHESNYTGIMKCGECGCSITAEVKEKLIKSTGLKKRYTYYHCTWKKPNYRCTQRKSIGETELEQQFIEIISRFTIDPEVKEWALNELKTSYENEFNQLEVVIKNFQNEFNSKQKEISNLTSMRIKDLIDDNEYKSRKDELNKELEDIKRNLERVESRVGKWNQITEKAFEFVSEAKQAFLKGDREARKQILLCLGSNYKVLNGKVLIEPYSWLVPIEKANSEIAEEIKTLEPEEISLDKGKTKEFVGVSTKWLERWDSNPRPSG